jgi:hypothetical protein
MRISRTLSLAAQAAVVSIPAANAQFGGMPGMMHPTQTGDIQRRENGPFAALAPKLKCC